MTRTCITQPGMRAVSGDKAEMSFLATEMVNPGPTLFLTSSLGIGGSERKVVRVVNAVTRKGHNVHLGYLNAPHTLREGVDEEVPVSFFDRRGKFSPRVVRDLRRYVSNFHIARLVCVNLYPLLYAQLVRTVLGRCLRPSVVLLINTTEHADRRAERFMAIYRPLISLADQVIFGCRAQQEIWTSRYGIDGRVCDLIYNGVDVAYFAREAMTADISRFRYELGLADDAFVVGSVGQLRPEKNQAELIAAMRRLKESLPNAVLIIAGDGPDRGALENTVDEMGLSNHVLFLGQVADVRPVLAVMDVLVLPSISETFSNAALEAMAMETPVILTDTGGAREMVTDGISGRLYRQGDVASLVGLLENLSAEPELGRQLGTQARAAVVEKFSATRMLRDYELKVLGGGTVSA